MRTTLSQLRSNMRATSSMGIKSGRLRCWPIRVSHVCIPYEVLCIQYTISRAMGVIASPIDAESFGRPPQYTEHGERSALLSADAGCAHNLTPLAPHLQNIRSPEYSAKASDLILPRAGGTSPGTLHHVRARYGASRKTPYQQKYRDAYARHVLPGHCPCAPCP